MKGFVVPFGKWREESFIFVYWFIRKHWHLGQYNSISHVQKTPGYMLTISPASSDSAFPTSGLKVRNQTFLQSCTLTLFLCASPVLCNDSSFTFFNGSLAKFNPISLPSSLSWLFEAPDPSYPSYLLNRHSMFCRFCRINMKHVPLSFGLKGPIP